MKMATLDGRLDLRELEPLAAAKFEKRALTTRWPSMFVANTYAEFAQRLFDRLGIGAGGNGSRALRLLARIQAGQQVRTVDGLYKAMVLEQPATYAAADSAAKHFDDLDRSYQEMQTAAEKQHTLVRLPQLWDEREQARADEKLIDTFGAGRAGDTPFLLWQLRTRDQLLDSATRAALKSRSLLKERCRAARTEHSRLKGELARVEGEQRAAGGDTIKRLKPRSRLPRLRMIPPATDAPSSLMAPPTSASTQRPRRVRRRTSQPRRHSSLRCRASCRDCPASNSNCASKAGPRRPAAPT